ncbi:tryptophan--tRNA ligase [Candidatus Woesearchaeota archaeon]|jgi:tryptophanyl-tRNA synthetase|nr:tryptophan--tRNA ligase [Candidatus Woesearchaeota archaeon]MBT7367042.1 tryptophan--tRNA ligase [Candidatus Woesearchaeota archaeon]
MANEFVVNPWEVKGDIDYDKLIKEFGLKPLQNLPEEFSDNVLFSRGFVFAHRDFNKILDCIKEKEPFVMMTGLMPTGKFHLGHMMVAQQMIFYQNLGAKIYIAVADIEAYHQRQQSLEDSKKIAIDEYITNYIALGLKPENCEIYFQSNRSGDGKKASAFYRLQNQLARHATFNEFKAVYGDLTPGKIIASTLQASDMLHAQLPEFEGKIPVVVPVGSDQDPHIRIARDMAKRFPEYQFDSLCSTYHKFMPGLGSGKMSASDPNSFIALTDSPSEVKKKINKHAFSGGRETLEEHRKLGGNPDIDVSYQYLTYFEEDTQKLKQIYDDYKSGKLLSGELKKILIDKLTELLTKHQEAREKAKYIISDFICTD